MTTINIPAADAAWLHDPDEKYRVQDAHGKQYVFPVDILPASLRKFIKSRNRYIDYVKFGPSDYVDNGKVCHVWGWTSKLNMFGFDIARWRRNIDDTKGLLSFDIYLPNIRAGGMMTQ